MNINFISKNKDKYYEAREVLPNLEYLELELTEIQHIDARLVVKAKLEEAFKHHEGPFIVEDSSLYLECLKGLPGPLIKWFLKTIGNTGLFDLSEKLENNKAEAKSIIGFARDKVHVEYFEGTLKGSIVSPRGDDGFGWDPIFLPAGYTKTFAELSMSEKNAISMRRVAFEKLNHYLDNN